MLFLIGLLVLQVIWLVSIPVNLYPELFFFPWLVARGLIPYRDFFDHHGFLLYYLLAFLSLDKSLLLIKFFYIFIQSANFGLFVLIVRRLVSKGRLLFISLIFILINFFVNENNLWFETIITFLYLTSFYLLNRLTRPSFFWSGLLIGLASIIKPTAGLLIVFLIFIYQNKKLFLGFALVWLSTIVFFFFHSAVFVFYQNLFHFNSLLPSFIRGTYHWQDKKFLIVTFLTLIISLVVLHKKILKRQYLVLVSYILISILFLYPFYGKAHLVVFTAFLPILFTLVLNYKKNFIYVLVCYLIYSIILNFNHWQFLAKNRVIYQNNRRTIRIVNYLKLHYPKQTVLVLGNQVEIYYYLNQLPPTYFPLYFKDWTGKFFPNYQKQTIHKLKTKKINLVIKPKPEDFNYLSLKYLDKYLKKNYQIKKTKLMQIYELKE